MKATDLILIESPPLRLLGCGALGVGVFLGSGRELVNAVDDSVPYVSTGVRIAFDVMLTERLSLRPRVEVTIPVSRVRVVDPRTTQELWRAPVVSGIFGLTFAGRIL